jgi:hypothetical protein
MTSIRTGVIREGMAGWRLITLALILTLAAGCSKLSKDSGGGKLSKDSGGGGKKEVPGANLSSYPATDEGARSVLLEFTKPGADEKTLLRLLRPTHADYEALFQPAFAQRAEAYHNSVWAADRMSMRVYRAQTDVVLIPITSAEIRLGMVKEGVPTGYSRLKEDVKDGFTFYCYYFVRPGEKLSAIVGDGLVHVNGHWRHMPFLGAL